MRVIIHGLQQPITRIVLVVVSFIALFAAVLNIDNRASATNILPCEDVEVVFARGSGQKIDESDEMIRFRDGLMARVQDPLTVNFYELGTTSQGGNKYPAVDVSNVWNGNAIGAALSRGNANDYGKSVDAGVYELIHYMANRYAACKNSQFILAGYSQGAHVVGRYLRSAMPQHKAAIAYVALFGDPKLHLPEGEGIRPPACRGEQLSEYRRVIASCHVDNGSLGARKPYLPADMHSETGLWCYANDFVCGSSKYLWDTAGHSRYGLEGHAVDSAVIEALGKIKARMPGDKADDIDTRRGRGDGTTGLDVMFVIDTTGSMWSQLEAAKQFAAESAEQIRAMRGRVALVSYRDLDDDYTARIENQFSNDMTEFTAKLQNLEPGGGGDIPEATLHALMVGMNSLEWQNGATKAAIILTDAGFHNPDLVDDSTIAQVAQRSQEIDPVNVYPVVSRRYAAEYQELAAATNGQVVIDSGNSKAALFEALGKIQQRPTALLKNPSYSAEVGQQITFDASDSYVEDAEIVSYDWDFDGDGTYELQTTDPITRHAYQAEFDGTMQVRLTASNDTISSASAFVQIGTYLAPAQTTEPQNLRVVEDNGDSVRVTWHSDDTSVDAWAVASDGVPIAKVRGDITTITVSDLLRDENITIDIAGMTSDGLVGEFTSIIIAAKQSPASTVPNKNYTITKPVDEPRLASLTNDSGHIISDGQPASPLPASVIADATDENIENEEPALLGLSTTKPSMDTKRPSANHTVTLALVGGILLLAVTTWLVYTKASHD